MIKHSVKDEVISLSINKVDFSYRIPLKKIGNISTWVIGDQSTEWHIKIQNVSSWTMQLFTKKVTDQKYINQFQEIVKEYAPKSNISWKHTQQALDIQSEYKWLQTAKDKLSEEEIIKKLEEKYQLA